jgi:hypothetical protein
VLRPMTMKESLLRELGADDWEVSHDGVLVCPCGRRVEDDGSCPDGHESPLRGAGLI